MIFEKRSVGDWERHEEGKRCRGSQIDSDKLAAPSISISENTNENERSRTPETSNRDEEATMPRGKRYHNDRYNFLA